MGDDAIHALAHLRIVEVRIPGLQDRPDPCPVVVLEQLHQRRQYRPGRRQGLGPTHLLAEERGVTRYHHRLDQDDHPLE